MQSFSSTISDIYFESTGTEGSPAVVLSHPLGSDLSLWSKHTARLASEYRVVCFDTRGHGRSAVPEQPLSLADLGEDVLRLLNHLSIKRAHFCGVSLGGLIGQWLGLRAPERLYTLTLADTAPRMGTPEVWEERIAGVQRNGLSSISTATMERWFTPEFREAQPSIVAHLKQVLETTPLPGYVACARVVQQGISSDVSYKQLGAIGVPVLVLTGAQDSAVPPEQARGLAAEIPGSRYLELSAAHLAPVEAFDSFLDAFYQTLRSNIRIERAQA